MASWKSFGKNLVTKYNPIAGTVRGVGKLVQGDLEGAAGAVAQGAIGPAGAALEEAGGLKGLAGLSGLGDTDTKGLDNYEAESAKRRGDYETHLQNYLTRTVPQVEAQESGRTEIAATPETQAAQIDPIERVQGAVVAPAQRVQASSVNAGQSDQVRQRQLGLADRFEGVLSGQAPSLAQAQHARNMADLVGNQFGQAAAARGTGRAALIRSAMGNAAGIQAKGALDAAMLQAKEQADARAGLGSVLDSARGQDIGVATTDANLAQTAATGNADRVQRTDITQAGLTQGAQVANAGAANTRATAQAGLTQENTQANAGRTQQRNISQGTLDQGNNQFNASQRQGAQGTNATNTLQGRQIDDAEKRDLRQNVGAEADRGADIERTKIQVDENDNNRRAGFAGGLIQAGGQGATALAMSDERSKKDVEPIDFTARVREHLERKDPTDEMRQFLEELRPVKFRYKDPDEPGTAPGQRYGVIAQDLERTPVGKSLVRDTPSGKMIDTNQAVPVLLASIAKMRDEMDKMRAKGAR